MPVEDQVTLSSNKNGELEIRYKRTHPDIGNYFIRVSKLILLRNRAVEMAKSLNLMVLKREGIGNRFKVGKYCSQHIIVRKVLPGDLLDSAKDRSNITF